MCDFFTPIKRVYLTADETLSLVCSPDVGVQVSDLDEFLGTTLPGAGKGLAVLYRLPSVKVVNVLFEQPLAGALGVAKRTANVHLTGVSL